MTKVPGGWQQLPIRDFADLVRRKINVAPDEQYFQIGIRSWGKGIFHKEGVLGSELGDKRVFWIEPGDFVVNIVFAWEGAVALVSDNEIGMCASHRFPTFVTNRELCEPEYLWRFFQSVAGVELLKSVSPGGAGRNKTLNQSTFLKLKIPLPPLAEQRKIAAILSTWDAAITLTRQLIAALQRRKQALMQLLLTGAVRFPGFEDEWEGVVLGEVASINPPKPNGIADDEDISFVAMADVSEDARLTNSMTRKYAEVKNGFTGFQNDDVLIAKITPCFENGKGALVEDLTNGVGFGSTEFHVARANDELITPEFIYYQTVSHRFRGTGEANMSGSAGQKRIPTEFLRSYPILLPPIDEQQQITAVLKACDEHLDILREAILRLQTQKRGLMQQLLTGAQRVRVGENG